MTLKHVPVRTFTVHKMCDDGGCSGEMLPIDMGVTIRPLGGPRQFIHECNSCHMQVTMSERYPHFSYEEITP